MSALQHTAVVQLPFVLLSFNLCFWLVIPSGFLVRNMSQSISFCDMRL